MYICDYRLEKKFVTYHQTGTIPKDPESNDYHLGYKMTLKYGAPEQNVLRSMSNTMILKSEASPESAKILGEKMTTKLAVKCQDEGKKFTFRKNVPKYLEKYIEENKNNTFSDITKIDGKKTYNYELSTENLQDAMNFFMNLQSDKKRLDNIKMLEAQVAEKEVNEKMYDLKLQTFVKIAEQQKKEDGSEASEESETGEEEDKDASRLYIV